MQSIVERFCRYVRIDTQARDGSGTYPSSEGQWDLARLLVQELKAIGLADAQMDDHALVMATIPATKKRPAPTVAWLAHMDTSPEFSGKEVKPILHENYRGQDIVLPGDPKQVLTVAENPELKNYVGDTIITSDGTTLLGADNKAGIAVIMEAAAHLIAHPEIPHGPIRVCFTCDEEIGHGVDYVDLKKLGARVAYTLDGMGQGEVEAETFSADKAIVTIHGTLTHPSIAKNKMVNAIKLAAQFLDRLPKQTLAPEHTAGREGFVHPCGIEGGVPQVRLLFLLRSFVTAELREQEQLLRGIAAELEEMEPRAKVEVHVEKQYRNMADGMEREPRAVPFALEAMRRAGLTPRLSSIRGGTDGARLTELGVPTPNLSTGEHNPHSPLEWTTLGDLLKARDVLVQLAQVWAEVEK
ncbi:MAG TPA: peptidase T [Gemmatales bacterium]|nr:peptidase T [Gemmatales bacterium]